MEPVIPKSAAGSSLKNKTANEWIGGAEVIDIIDDDSGLSKASTKDRSMSLTEGIYVKFEMFNDCLYREEEILVPIDQTRDPFLSLRDFGDGHERALFNSVKRFGYDYALGLMPCTFVSDGNPENFNLTNIIDQTQKPPMLNADALVSIIDGRHIHAAIDRINKEMNEDLHDWSRGHIMMIFMSRVDGNEMKTGELLILSKLGNGIQGMVRKDTSFISVMNTVLQHAKTFQHDYGTSIIDYRVKDVVDDIRSSHFLGQISVASYARYVRISRLFVKFPTLLNIVETMCGSEEKVLGRTPLGHPILYNADYDDVMIYLKSLQAFLSGEHSNSFHPESFNSRSKNLLLSLTEVYNSNFDTSKITFKGFLNNSI